MTDNTVEDYKEYLDNTTTHKRVFWFNEKYALDVDLIENWRVEENIAIINFKKPVKIDGSCQIRIEYENEAEAIEVMNRMWEMYCK